MFWCQVYFVWNIFVMLFIILVTIAHKIIIHAEYNDVDFTQIGFGTRKVGVNHQSYIQSYYILVEILYIPACLAVLRTFTCRTKVDEDLRWSHDLQCWSGGHYIQVKQLTEPSPALTAP